MKRYFIEINGKKIEVTKEISDEVRANAGASRHERYVIFELAPKHELSLDDLIKSEYPVEMHMVEKLKTPEEQILNEIQLIALKQTIRRLNQDERELIAALYYEGLSERTVAEYMECSQTKVWYQKQKVLEKLKKLLTS